MSSLYYQSAVDVAGGVQRDRLDAAEVAESIYDRISALNDRVNAVCEVIDPTSEGQVSDDGSRLAGVPVTIKDAIAVAGARTTWGNPDWEEARADFDAAVVSRLRQSGATVVGKTNVAFMLMDFGQSANPVFGRTNNPWDLARSTGGSSGGAAAAVACGMSFLDVGSDVVGSIRIPASFCGVYGLKPTAGIVPMQGFQPPGPAGLPTLLDDMAALGPIARTATDLRAGLLAMAGPTPPAANSVSWSLRPPRHRELADFRVGVVLDSPGRTPATDVGEVLQHTIDAVAASGATVVPGWPEDYDPSEDAETFEYLIGAYLAFKQGDATDGPDLSELIDYDARRRKTRAVWDQYFADIDVLVCPTTVATAPPHHDDSDDDKQVPTVDGDRAYSDLAAWVPPASVAGLPALSAPVGLSGESMPVGLQIIGPRFEDDTVLTFAEALTHVAAIDRHPIE